MCMDSAVQSAGTLIEWATCFHHEDSYMADLELAITCDLSSLIT